jgi:hypothetical protein
VRFTPSAIGARTGTLTLTHNAAGGSTVISLSATGAGSAWTASPNPVGLGNVTRGTTKTQSISVRNSGTASGRISAAAIANAVPVGAAFAVNQNPATSTCLAAAVVAPGRTCTIVVSFSPTLVGAHSAALVLTSDSTGIPARTTVSLTGTGR